jgi:hypothetical protein
MRTLWTGAKARSGELCTTPKGILIYINCQGLSRAFGSVYVESDVGKVQDNRKTLHFAIDTITYQIINNSDTYNVLNWIN